MADETMSDQELVRFVGLANESRDVQKRWLAKLRPGQREVYDKMRQIEFWDKSDGAIPLPEGVIVCRDHKGHRHG